jgi:hypothetical protein
MYSFVSPVLFSLIVLFLGFATPGYDHLRQTISELALGQYGWIQRLNFLQFGVGFVGYAALFSGALTSRKAKLVWVSAFLVSALLAVTMAAFPSDPLSDFPTYVRGMSLHGRIHLGVLFLFFLAAPFGIGTMVSTLREEPGYAGYARLTAACGYTASVLCFLWIVLYVGGWLPYRGLLQKIIAAVCVYWIVAMLRGVRQAKSI